ncbi:MAG: hypothetical protein A2X36_07175 [Elusimicrobia bacterium GWA2_69_24]|nr:MAG: hypothetical protein A2X36_07175 [Elusimicrobia bacterium GWA2_69_24]
MKTLLLACGSLGLGNSTRMLGIVQVIRHRLQASRQDLRIVVCAGGNSARFWAAHSAAAAVEVLPLDVYEFTPRQSESPRLRWSGFLRPRTAGVYLRNSLRLRSFLKANPVDLALIDSDYHCLPLLLSRTSILALGQAWDVVRRYEEIRRQAEIPPASMLVERLDLRFQRLVSRRILAPSFQADASGATDITAVPLIVREEFTAPAGPEPGTGAAIHVLLSGSGIGAAPMLDYAEQYGLPVIRSLRDRDWALDAGGRPLIDRARAVIVQGGLSSISECIARRRKMLVCPIAGHAEQLANAFEVERRGLGMRTAELTLPPELLLERLDRVLAAAPKSAPPRCDGAEVVARLLLEPLGLAAR